MCLCPYLGRSADHSVTRWKRLEKKCKQTHNFRVCFPRAYARSRGPGHMTVAGGTFPLLVTVIVTKLKAV